MKNSALLGKYNGRKAGWENCICCQSERRRATINQFSEVESSTTCFNPSAKSGAQALFAAW
jgi:hypothetical protein